MEELPGMKNKVEIMQDWGDRLAETWRLYGPISTRCFKWCPPEWQTTRLPAMGTMLETFPRETFHAERRTVYYDRVAATWLEINYTVWDGDEREKARRILGSLCCMTYPSRFPPGRMVFTRRLPVNHLEHIRMGAFPIRGAIPLVRLFSAPQEE